MQTAKAFWTLASGEGALREEQLEPLSGQVTIQALFSGVSRGTESLVFHGQVPATEYQRMRAPFQAGNFPFPVKYGYASVGRVVEGPERLRGQTVFCLHPHQDVYQVPETWVHPLPAGVPPERAVLAANLETAINGLWDSGASLGDRIAVVGLGVVGLLVAWLARQIPGTRVTGLDVRSERHIAAEALGVGFQPLSGPDDALADDHDIVFHCSGHPAGLATALSMSGVEARVVEMSWYGNRPVSVPLGEAFHARRLQLISSQVGTLPAARRSRWTHRQRLALALNLLNDPALDALISGESRFSDWPTRARDVLAGDADTLCHRLRYPAADE